MIKMKKWFIRLFSFLTRWVEKFDDGETIKIDDDTYLVLMNKEEYQEWLEYSQNLFLVYENEQELKNDFPEAKRRK